MAHYVIFDMIDKKTNSISRRYLLNISVEDSYYNCSAKADRDYAIFMIKKDYHGYIPSTYRMDIHVDDIKIIQKYGIENYKFIDYYDHNHEKIELPYYPEFNREIGNIRTKSVWTGGSNFHYS